MTFISAGPSPAWLGVFGIISFGGLVIAAFASGYHLASDPPPRAARPRVESAAEEPQPVLVPRGPGRVAEPLADRQRAVLRAEPVDGEIVDELPAGRSITILEQSDDWLMLRYERDGQVKEGWAHRVNIEAGTR